MKLKKEFLLKLKAAQTLQLRMALKMGVTPRTIGNWIADNNIQLCDSRALKLMAIEWNVSPNYLYELGKELQRIENKKLQTA